VIVDVALGPSGAVAELAQQVRACALGRASAAIMAAFASGRTRVELVAARDLLRRFLDGDAKDREAGLDLRIFDAARSYPSRHAAILLPFEAVLAATDAALGRSDEHSLYALDPPGNAQL
jgi:NifU-like protein involved in Fe-S cluster formation